MGRDWRRSRGEGCRVFAGAQLWCKCKASGELHRWCYCTTWQENGSRWSYHQRWQGNSRNQDCCSGSSGSDCDPKPCSDGHCTCCQDEGSQFGLGIRVGNTSYSLVVMWCLTPPTKQARKSSGLEISAN